MNSIEINTSQNVNLDFTLASAGDRILAFLIDTVIKGGIFTVIWMVFFKFLNLGAFLAKTDNMTAIAIYTLLTLPIDVYTLVFESVTEGQTPGKKMMQIKVVKTDGYQADFSDYFIRWVFRLVDIIMSTGLIAIVSIIVNRQNKRLGDIAAGTAVISLKQKYTINHTILVNIDKSYQPQFPQVVGLSDNDMRIIKENFLKERENHDPLLIQKLAGKIAATIGVTYDKKQLSDRQFIKTIIRDYNYYTGNDQ